MIKINEDYNNDKKVIKLIIQDPDKELLRLLDYIRYYSTIGHSFDIICDPDDKECREEFFIDGDGATKLYDLQRSDGTSLIESMLNEDSAVLEVPDGKNIESLPVSHFKSLIDKKGKKKIWRALTNLEVWFKNKNPKLSKWAIGMKKSLGDYGEKE